MKVKCLNNYDRLSKMQNQSNNIESKQATQHTKEFNSSVQEKLPFSDQSAFKNAQKGFIATLEKMAIPNPKGDRMVFDLTRFDFLKKEAPDTVNPSLWRQAQLTNLYHGLYEVTDGIYQIRSFDLANMTLIKGDTGWLIIDPLGSVQTAAAGLNLANEQLGERPVTGVIYTHSHIDHFGGGAGVVNLSDAQEGKVAVIAPFNFVKEALSENIVVGNAMRRRAQYMYGLLLQHSPEMYVGDGLGPDVSSGFTSFVPPNDVIVNTGEKRVVDGIEIEFLMATDTEAVAEIIFYFPKFKALCTSEVTSHHLHNVYTPRGAQIRDTFAWSKAIDESIDLFGDRLEVQFAQHHWPTWGQKEAVAYLEKQRDLYKYIHDQTLRLANHGYTKEEIAEQLSLPESLAQDFSCRDYYGTLKHNSKAVYVRYLGYFDANPATLDPLPPAEAAVRYVEFMGGAQLILEKAEKSFKCGEYRWVAQVLNHLVLAEPENKQAKELLADAYEQLGYQAESGPWRNFYLTGALELRQKELIKNKSFIHKFALEMPLENFFQFMSVRLNGPKAEGVILNIEIVFDDVEENYFMKLGNSVLNIFKAKSRSNPDLRLFVSEGDFKSMMMKVSSPSQLVTEEKLKIKGEQDVLEKFIALFEDFPKSFPIVTPRPSE